jgi:hypothetical protein
LKAFVLLVEQFADRLTRSVESDVEFLLDPPIDLGPVVIRSRRDLLRLRPLLYAFTPALAGELLLLLIVLAAISPQRIFIQKVFS